jgi:hypothetical protein
MIMVTMQKPHAAVSASTSPMAASNEAKKVAAGRRRRALAVEMYDSIMLV